MPSFRFPSIHLPKPPAPNVFKSVGDFFKKKLSFQPPGIPTFGSNLDEMGPFRMPKLPSLLSFFNSTDAVYNRQPKEDGLPADYFQVQNHRKSNFLSELWHEKTKDSKGLLVYIIPTLINQMALLHSMSVFLFDRLAQYFQPMMVVLACALTSPIGVKFVQKGLFFSISLGALYMFKDTISAGSYWAPLGPPTEESYALVTGATSGIGLMLAEMLYEEGYNLVLVARSDQTLKNVKHRLDKRGIEKMREREEEMDVYHHRSSLASDRSDGSSTKVEGGHERESDSRLAAQRSVATQKLQDVVTLSCDLRDSWTPNYIHKELEHLGVLKKLDILINNAGVGSTGKFLDSGTQEYSDIVDLNVKSTVALTRLISPHMRRVHEGKHGGARILNIGSIAGCAPGPNAAVYSASKAFMSSFTFALRRELMKDGIICCLATPGPVKSKFAEASGSQNSLIFKLPFFAMSSYDAATQIYFGMKQGRDVIVPGALPQIYSTFLVRTLPTTVMADFVKFVWGPGLEIRKGIMSLIRKKSHMERHGKKSNMLLLKRPEKRSPDIYFDSQSPDELRENSTNSDKGYNFASPSDGKGDSRDSSADNGSGDNNSKEGATNMDRGTSSDSNGDSFLNPNFPREHDEGDTSSDSPQSDVGGPNSASEAWSKSWKEEEKSQKRQKKRRREKAVDDSFLTDWNTYVF